jgi:hypothetical protein
MKRGHMSALTKWSPFRLSPTWDPFREFEEMRNRFFAELGLRRPIFRTEPEEWFTPTATQRLANCPCTLLFERNI